MDLMDLALEFRDYEWCKKISKIYERYEKEEKEKDVKKQEDLKRLEKEEVPIIENNVATIDKPEVKKNEMDDINIVDIKKKIYMGIINENMEQYLLLKSMIKYLSLEDKIAYIVYNSQGNTNKEDAKILIEVLESMGN
jgi:hypothetical protein